MCFMNFKRQFLEKNEAFAEHKLSSGYFYWFRQTLLSKTTCVCCEQVKVKDFAQGPSLAVPGFELTSTF